MNYNNLLYNQTVKFHNHEGDCDSDSTEETGYHKRSRVSSSDDMSEIKQLLIKLIKKVDSNDRVLKELQKNQETSSNTYVYSCVCHHSLQYQT